MNAVQKKQTIFLFILTVLLVLFFYDRALAQNTTTTDEVFGIIQNFYEKTAIWTPILEKYTVRLFRLLFIINIAIFGITVALKRTSLEDVIQEFTILLLFSGFIMAVIMNYEEWSWNIIDALQTIAHEVTSNQSGASKPFSVGIDLCKKIISFIRVTRPVDSLDYIMTGLIVMICFALLSAQIIYIKCEAIIAMSASMILLGLGGLKQTQEYAINVMRYIIAVAFKLFSIELLLGLGISFIESLRVADKPEFEELFIIIGASIILYVLVKSLPDTISGIINGSHVSSGHQLASAVMSIAAVAGGGAMAAGAGAVNMGRAANAADNMAKEQGHTGVGRLGHTAKNIMNAYGQARQQMPGRSSMAKMLDNAKANLESAREASKLDDQ